MKKLKIGLLPLYIKLYDDFFPEMEERNYSFYDTIAKELEKKDIEVVTSSICRVEPEFAAAAKRFEAEDADAIITLHLAYSPSLESAGVLAATRLPIIVLDTTPTFDYSPSQHPDELMYNHGIHGVQDMCNLLLRSGKPFIIEAGHWSESDVLDRAAQDVKAARIAKSLQNAKVGRFGGTFTGMGDFDGPGQTLQETIGIETVEYDIRDQALFGQPIAEGQIEAEMSQDIASFYAPDLEATVHRQSTLANLSIRKLIDEHQLTAFTVNFMNVTAESALTSMPFLEASKSMARGIGYAGEGDVLTAAFVGALLSVYPDTSFTEMFCPDWQHNSIFLSHMGEMNIQLCSEKPVIKEMNFAFTDAQNPVVAYGRFRGGEAVYVNLAPGRDKKYTFIVSPIEMLDIEGTDNMAGSIRGWFKPQQSVADFLAAYSRHGGTHHGAIVYGEAQRLIRVMEELGNLMKWDIVVIN